MIEKEPGIGQKIEAVRDHAKNMRDDTKWDDERQQARVALIILFKDTGIKAIYDLIEESRSQTKDYEF